MLPAGHPLTHIVNLQVPPPICQGAHPRGRMAGRAWSCFHLTVCLWSRECDAPDAYRSMLHGVARFHGPKGSVSSLRAHTGLKRNQPSVAKAYCALTRGPFCLILRLFLKDPPIPPQNNRGGFPDGGKHEYTICKQPQREDSRISKDER